MSSISPMVSETDDEIQREAKIALVIMGVLFLIVIVYYYYTTYHNQRKTTFTRFKDFYRSSFSEFSILLIVAFFVSNVIYAFNFYIMNPFVQSIFPGGDIWGEGINILRGQEIYPGLFLQSIVVFIMSLGTLFIIIEISVNMISSTSSTKTIDYASRGFFWFSVIIFTILFIWNIIELVQRVDEEDIMNWYSYLLDTTTTPSSTLHQQKTINDTPKHPKRQQQNFMPFLVTTPSQRKKS